MSSLLNGLLVGGALSLNDVISFGITKMVYLKQLPYGLWMLLIPTILYGFQISLFYYGLHKTSMTILNIIWNLISNILITLLGIYYFKEKVNSLQSLAIFFALTSIVLFTIDSYNEK
jgi:multidrug transporter EmrE-like cation transporter